MQMQSIDKNRTESVDTHSKVEEVRDTTFKVEDIIDEYTHLMNKRGKAAATGFLYKILCDTKNVEALRKIVVRLQNIKEKLHNLSDA